MFSSDVASALRKGLFYFGAAVSIFVAPAAELPTTTNKNQPKVAAASNEGQDAIRSLQLPPGFKAELMAAEPHLANPVAFHIDEQGRIYVCETFRLHAGVTDIRGHMDWLDEDLASRTVDDRYAMLKRHVRDFNSYAENADRLRILFDRNGDGKIDDSKVFADGFKHPLDGLAAGVLARKGDVYLANIPNLWLLKDTNNDGVADFEKSLSYGYGVRFNFIGHDLHGLTFGPDGRLYFSIGDRGSAIKIGGKTIGDVDSGSVFRCFPDGSGLEVFASGLRNPQELAFDDQGNLFTGDNNSDGGDKARWVYVVEGGDCGWRVGFQYLTEPNSRGMWNSEKMWYPQWPGQAAYIVPPITNITSGPSGLTYYPGTGMPEKYAGHFFLVDFRGGRGSGIHTFATKQNGATFEVVDHEMFVGEGLPTDCDFGTDGGLYFSDWVTGWGMTGKGRIYRVYETNSAKSTLALETKKLRAEGFEKRSAKELIRLLAHADQRVRQEAQFELAARGEKSLPALSQAARKNDSQLARLHAIWGLWQLGLAHVPNAQDTLFLLLHDRDAEVRAQSAKVLGEIGGPKNIPPSLHVGTLLHIILNDPEPRPRFFAAIALGKVGRPEAVADLIRAARANEDVYIRHAIVMGLTGIADSDALLKFAKDESPNARMAVLLALRRLERAEVAQFLKDADPLLVLEAARAINDIPISGGMSDLANVPLSNKTTPELARRVVNANFRFGTTDSAKTLLAIASNEDLPNRTRVDAMEDLANWEHPSGRDRITGLWRPTAGPRNPNDAKNALRPQITKLLAGGSDQVRLAAARAARELELSEAAPELARWIKESAGTARMRIEALTTLNAIAPNRLSEVLPAALNDKLEEVRREAIKFSAASKTADPTQQLVSVLTTGSVGEKQSALAALANLEAGDKLLGEWLEKLARGEAQNELYVDIIEAASKRPALKDKAEKIIANIAAKSPIQDWSLALYGGNAAEGRKIFFERAEVSCMRCHRVGGEGGEVGPDLTGYGAKQTREYIAESIAFPNKHIAKGFESLLVALKNGTSYAGIMKSEDDANLVLNSPEDGIVTIKKSDIQSRTVGSSGMPEGMAQILGRKDFRDLIEVLATQK
ncbi:MAG TPA: PVC-type heme-binding CxxCH protein [Verrucomicrobiae bacterium]|nr:PVC-type heme-binding CxxCH protein [Verrucomicrobiae bacterium]